MCEVNLLSMELAKSERDSAELRSQAAADSLMSYETDCLKRKLASVQRMAKQSMARGVVASYASLRIGAHTYSSESICPLFTSLAVSSFLAKYRSLRARGPIMFLCASCLPSLHSEPLPSRGSQNQVTTGL